MNLTEYRRLGECEERHWWFRSLHRSLLMFIAAATRGNRGAALDIGCGTGGLAKKLKHKGFDVTAIDFSPLATQLLQSNDKTIKAVRGDVNILPFASDSFDLLVCVDVLESEAVDPEKTVREALRVLKPNGVGLFQIAAHQWLLSEHDRAVHSVRRMSISQLGRYFERAGVKVLRVTYLFFLLFPFLVFWKLFRSLRHDSPREDVVSDVWLPPRILNALLEGIMAVETLLLKWINLPMGTSACIVVRKEAEL